MRLSKNNCNDLIGFNEDLGNFLYEMHGKKLDARTIVVDAASKNENSSEYLCFDSERGTVSRSSLPIAIDAIEHSTILSRLELDPDYSIIVDSTPDNEVLKKQKIFFIVTLLEKPRQLLYEYLHSYLSLCVRFLHNRYRLPIADIIGRKKDILTALVKKYIDIDIINMLSSSKYEKRELTGSLIFTKDKDDAKYKVKFGKKIAFNIDSMRLVRKVFEMSDLDKSIVVHDKHITGLGTRDQIYKKVTFAGNQKWTLNIGNRNIIRFSHGKYFFDDGITTSWSDIPKGFVLKKFEKHFNELIGILSQQKHGALLIISNEAQQEVARLAELERGYAIDTLNLKEPRNTKLITNLSNVDGAVFVDTHLNCYGTGVILDGIAKRVGSNARGSRYNSARCYLDNKTTAQYVAIVFSEDETVDILDNLDG